jgi:hypothetical protein
MEVYRNFSQLKTNELSVVRHGFLHPWYEFTDGEFCYGKLSYDNLWRLDFLLETQNSTWALKRRSLFHRTFLIEEFSGSDSGKVTSRIGSRKLMLNMIDGFEATFFNKRVFTNTFTFTNIQHGNLLVVRSQFANFAVPFKVFIDLNKLKDMPKLIPTLALLGVGLILIKQTKTALLKLTDFAMVARAGR